MKITIVGTGYVGLVTGTCFAEMGTQVTCIDVDRDKIEKLNNGIMPIFEPGLEELVKKNAEQGRLSFSTSLKDCLEDSNIFFSAVGTPPGADGSTDLQYVIDVATTIGRYATDYFLLVTKSTVPVGTASIVRGHIQKELDARKVDIKFDIASNPEFLKEGAAIKDFMYPDRVVVGVDSDRAKQLMKKLYEPFVLNGFAIIFMDIASAEMTKYAANCMLATRISFMNEIANLCEKVGADIDMIRKGIGSDPRIGSEFLYAGVGYGGSCFPKDIKSLYNVAQQNGCDMHLIKAVEEVNNNQKRVLFNKLSSIFEGDLKGKTVAIWGLAFKPETDDIREAPSLVVIERLLKNGAKVRGYDPIAMSECKKIIGDSITYCNNIYETVEDADAIVLMTEWKQFRLPSWSMIRKSMRGNIIVDGRNIYNKEELKEEGFNYYCIGK